MKNSILAFCLSSLLTAFSFKLKFSPEENLSFLHSRASKTGQKLLLVSFDGFRHDYIEKYDCKNLKMLHKLGLRTRWIQDQFVTKTFPNHWTIVTGLYEEAHGIVSNHFWDPTLQKEFNAFGRPAYKWAWDPKFWGGEPVWKTNERQGGKSGSFFWVGSEVPVMRPSFWERYNTSYPWEKRVDTVVDWFENGNVNFATLYVDEPDHHGHVYGPSATKEMQEILTKVDNLVGYLLAKLPSDINLIITSDHGMEDISKDKAIIVGDVLKSVSYDKWFGEETHAGVWASEDNLKILHAKLKNFHPKLTIWFRDEIPERFHIKKNSRVPPLLLSAEEPWIVARTLREAALKGQHGYDNQNFNMHPIFLAKGPAFVNEPDKFIKPFNSVDIYSLMCEILKIKPHFNNGTLCEVGHLLKEKPEECFDRL